LKWYSIDAEGCAYEDPIGVWVYAETAEAEITRLTAEVERKSAEIGAINDSLGVLDLCQVGPLVKDAQSRAETAEAQLAELQEEKELLYRKLRQRDDHNVSLASALDEAKDQLSELRSRVRPGVEEIRLALCELKIEYNYVACEDQVVNADDVAQALHAIIPPVPKVLSVEEIYNLILELFPKGVSWPGQAMKIARALRRAMGGEG
jgi:chromosome segregation ATPase